jgi:thioredoxin 1
MQLIHTPQTLESFFSLLPNNKPVLVDFYATWCEPCKYLDTILEEMVPLLDDRAEIFKLDVDKQPALQKEYTIMSVPTLMIFKNGELKWRMAGFQLAKEMVETVLSHV